MWRPRQSTCSNILYASQNYICVLISHTPPPLTKQHANVFSCHNTLSCLIHCTGTVCLPVVVVCLSVEAERGCGPAFECKYACILIYSIRSVNYTFRASHAERDANMKRQLVEDLKTRLKVLQEMEKSYRGQVEDLEKKVHPAQGKGFVVLSLQVSL